MRKYSAAVVGGGSGGRLSLTALSRSPRFELVAAADLRPEVCAELKMQYPGVETFQSHREMFKSRPTDIVCVSTFPPSHRDVTVDALSLPLKGILVEKPLGDTAGAGREILARIRERGLPMAVPHGLLVAPHALEILQRVHAGEIGQLMLVEIENSRWDIINAGIHWLNFFVALTQAEPIDHVLSACESSTRTYRDGMQVETTAVTSVQTRGGVRCLMTTGDHVQILPPEKSTSFRLFGTKGTIEFWGWNSQYRIRNEQHASGTLIESAPGERPGHQIHLENLVAQMDEGRPDYRIAESSQMALELCEAAYLSSRHRCKVAFPLEAFAIPADINWDPGKPYSGSGGGRDGRKLESAS